MKIALFDMDGTLTPARKEMGAAVVESLRELMQAGFDIGIVSGSDFDYISSQCNLFFTDIRTDLSRVFIFPCNGTKKYTWDGSSFRKDYSADMINHIGKEKYRFLLQTVTIMQSSILKTYDLPYTGTFFHYRGSMLNWCPIGRTADSDSRKAWVQIDRDEKIREKYFEQINDFFNTFNIDLSVALGGSTSFDIYPIGWDKTYAMKHLEGYNNVTFVGDKCLPGGNDYELYKMLQNKKGCQSFSASSPDETIKIIKKIIPSY